MRFPARLGRVQHHQQTAPDSPPSYSTTVTKIAVPSSQSPTVPTASEDRLQGAIDDVLSFFKQQGVTLDGGVTVNHDYEATLTRATCVLLEDFSSSLTLSRLLSQAWTLLWCHHYKQAILPLRSCHFCSKQHEVKKAMARCSIVRRELCTHQVNILTKKTSSTAHLPRRYRYYSTETCDDCMLDDTTTNNLRTIVALDLEQSTTAIATPREYTHVPKVQYYPKCGHFCATCPYCDNGVCPICCANAKRMRAMPKTRILR